MTIEEMPRGSSGYIPPHSIGMANGLLGIKKAALVTKTPGGTATMPVQRDMEGNFHIDTTMIKQTAQVPSDRLVFISY